MTTEFKKAVIAICEGGHDTAFLYRLFKVEGFGSCNKMNKDYPKPIRNLILKALESFDYSEINLRETYRKPKPQSVLEKGDTLVLLYAMGGDGQRKKRQKLINGITKFKATDKDELEATKSKDRSLDYSIIYFLDANSKGIAKRYKEVADEIKDIFKGRIGDGGQHIHISEDNKLQEIHGYMFGCYILSDSRGYGNLEDVILPIMEKGNEVIFRKAEDFLELRHKINTGSDSSKENCRWPRKDFDEKKSKIGAAGQLQKSGVANTVIIQHCDYLTDEKIENSDTCKDIMKFIRTACS